MANANIILLYFCNYVDVFFALLINCKNRCWGKYEFIWGGKCVLLLLDAPTGGKSNISSKPPSCKCRRD